MAKISFSTKRLQIDKANSTIVIVIAVAAFISVFSLVASQSLLSKRAYQSRVIGEKEKAVKQLKENLTARDSLVSAYRQFVEAPSNTLGGDPKGKGDKDGDNAKIVLDALPSKYDFPALAASLEKILTDRNYNIKSITGVDDEIAQQNMTSPTPQPIDIPFEISISGTYQSMPNLISLLEHSIRPFHINTLNFKGTNASMEITITAKTFYQPEKNLNITTKVVK